MNICKECDGLGCEMDRAGWYQCKACGGLGTVGWRSTIERARAAAYWKLRSTLSVGRYVVFGDCGHFCKRDIEFVFVPEADCPMHDPCGRWHYRVSLLALRLRPAVIDTEHASV